MTEQDRIVARWYGFYAGEETPDTIYVQAFRGKANDPSAPVICFYKEDDPKTWIFGTFIDKRIVPVEEQDRAELRDLGNAILKQGNYPVDEFQFLDSALVTSVSKSEYDDLCEKVGASSTIKESAVEPFEDSEYSVSAHRKNRFNRRQYAALVIGITSFLSLVYGRQLVWADFYLLNGTFLREQYAAWLYAAWCVPLTLFNAFVAPKHRGMFTVILLSFAPLAIRQLSLMRNYSIALMWVCFGIVVLLSGVTFCLCYRSKKQFLYALEKMRNVAASLLLFVFTVVFCVDLFVPSVSARKIDPVAKPSETETRQVSQDDLDMLSSTRYDSLPVEEKARILLSVMEEMSDTLGISTPALIVDADIQDNVSSYYNPADNSVHLWKAYIQQTTAPYAVDTVLHELFHSFQQNVISSTAIDWDSSDLHRNAVFERALMWKTENESYIGFDRWDVNWEAYAGQAMESDANAFADAYNEHFINYEKLIKELESDSVPE